jgi:hypothetical protein
MKKQSRIALKGDTALLGTQEEPQKRDLGREIAFYPGRRLYKNGREYTLETITEEVLHPEDGWQEADPGPAAETDRRPRRTVSRFQTMAREELREWLNNLLRRELPFEFLRDFRVREPARYGIEHLTLGEVLPGDTLMRLNRLAGQGIPAAGQVAGAVAAWCSYAERLKAELPAGEALGRLQAAPGLLDCNEYERAISDGRGAFVNPSTAEFLRDLMKRGQKLPQGEAGAYMEALADLIEYHPGLEESHEALMAFADAALGLEYHKVAGTV